MQKHFFKIFFLLAIFFMLPSFAKAADITACGTISATGTYVLQNDISAAGTCMTINAGSVVLDLNGHTITYNTAAGDSVYGVLIAWNKVGIRVTNSNPANGGLVQGAGNGYLSAGVYSQQARNVEIDHLIMNYQGENNSGIVQNGGGFAVNVNIHDNILFPNGTKRATSAVRATVANGGSGYSVGQRVTLVGGTGTPSVFVVNGIGPGGSVLNVGQYDLGGYSVLPPVTDCTVVEAGGLLLDVTYGPTHYGGFSAITVVGSGGDINISDNRIEGKGYSGIGFGYALPLTNMMTINRNTIKMAAPVRDGYAISIGSGSNDDVGFEIADNIIEQSSGRGILVAGNYNADSPGPGDGIIHDNSIDIREPRDAGEYDAPGTGVGIQLRFGAHDVQIYNNTVHAHAGLNACPAQFATSQGDDCIGIGIKVAAGLHAVNNQIFNNTVESDSTDASLRAVGLYAIAVSDGSNVFYGNTVTSNSVIVDLNGSDGAGSNFVFRSNSFIKGANPFDFHSIRVGNWTNTSVENVFLDNNWQNGAIIDDVLLAQSGGANYSFYVKWYLNILVKDAATNQPLPGAAITALANGANETVSGATNSSGEARLELMNYKHYGMTYPPTNNYDQYTPHDVTASKAGYIDGVVNVTMDSTKNLTMALTPLNADVIAPAAPSGLNVQ